MAVMKSASLIFKGGPARLLKERGRAKHGKPRRSKHGYQKRNDNLKRLGYDDYAHYLAGEAWATIRAMKMAVDPLCAICKSPATQVHHNSYSIQTLTGLNQHGLASLCRCCHKDVEFFPGGKKRTFQQAFDRFQKQIEAARP